MLIWLGASRGTPRTGGVSGGGVAALNPELCGINGGGTAPATGPPAVSGGEEGAGTRRREAPSAELPSVITTGPESTNRVIRLPST